MDLLVRVLVDSLVADSANHLMDSLQHAEPQIAVEIFDPFLSPAQIASIIESFQPDLVLLDPAWFPVSVLVLSLIRLTAKAHTRTVIALPHIDDVAKIRVAHRNFFDVVGTQTSSDELLDSLHRIHNGTSSLEQDPLWLRIPKPSGTPDISQGPKDHTDVAILDLVCIGLHDAHIAEALAFSLQTVKNRISQMLTRTGVQNRTQLAWQYSQQQLTASMMQNIQNESVSRRL